MRTAWLVVAVVLVCCICPASQRVKSHQHTVYSDGSKSVVQAAAEAREQGNSAIVYNDHAEEIRSEFKRFDIYNPAGGVISISRIPGEVFNPVFLLGLPSPIPDIRLSKEAGNSLFLNALDRYADDVRRVGSEDRDKGMVGVLGLECGFNRPDNFPALPRQNHALVVHVPTEGMATIIKIVEDKGITSPQAALDEVIAVVASYDGAIILAHPYNQLYPFELEWNRAVERAAALGVEFFNGKEGEFDQNLELMKKIQRVSKRSVPVWGGSDDHGSPNEVKSIMDMVAIFPPAEILKAIDTLRGRGSDFDCNKVYTLVETNARNAEAIATDIRDGHACAAHDGAGFNAKIWPGHKFEPTLKDSVWRFSLSKVPESVLAKTRVVLIPKNSEPPFDADDKALSRHGGDFAVDFKKVVAAGHDNVGWWVIVACPNLVTSSLEVGEVPREPEKPQPPPQPASKPSGRRGGLLGALQDLLGGLGVTITSGPGQQGQAPTGQGQFGNLDMSGDLYQGSVVSRGVLMVATIAKRGDATTTVLQVQGQGGTWAPLPIVHFGMAPQIAPAQPFVYNDQVFQVRVAALELTYHEPPVDNMLLVVDVRNRNPRSPIDEIPAMVSIRAGRVR